MTAGRAPLNLYAGDELLAEYRLDSVTAGMDLGYSIDRFSELRAGYETGYLRSALLIGSPQVPSVSGRTGTARVRYALDRLDSPIIPRRGVALVSTAGYVDASPGTSDSFPSAETNVAAFLPVSERGRVYGIAAGGTTFGDSETGIPQFTLGGPSRLAAYGINEFLVNQYLYGRVGYLHRVGQLPAFLGQGIYLTTHFELAKPYRPVDSPGLTGDGVLGLVAETMFGPFMIGGSAGGGHFRWFFQLGRIF
jgi:NTE family protein